MSMEDKRTLMIVEDDLALQKQIKLVFISYSTSATSRII